MEEVETADSMPGINAERRIDGQTDKQNEDYIPKTNMTLAGDLPPCTI